MVIHGLSANDRRFQADFESCRLSPARFNHRTHLRIAYIYLCEHADETALAQFRKALLRFLEFHGVDVSKYHETLTGAWILAVRHFMEKSTPSSSFEAFIERNPVLLDSRIMLTHYTTELLFSPEARRRFVEPDLSAIPRHVPSSA